MPRDGQFTLTDPTEDRLSNAYNAFYRLWQSASARAEQAKKRIEADQLVIEAAEAEMAEHAANGNKLMDAAELIGIDLRIVGSVEEMPAEQAADQEFSIKDYVLEQARLAHPNPIRASSIRDHVRALGHPIHDKTIGMSLYRWSQKGVLRREGKADWYYIPVAERAPGSAQDGHDDIA